MNSSLHRSAAHVSKPRWVALLALFSGAIVIGSSGIFVRLAQTGVVATTFWRGALALPVLALLMVLSRSLAARRRGTLARPQGVLWKDVRIWWAGVFFAADLVLWNSSILLTSVAVATLEACLAPVALTVFAWLCWKLRPTRASVVALALALLGLALILSPKLDRVEAPLTGDILGVGAACFYAAYLVTIARLRAVYETAAVMFFTTLAFTVVLVPMLPTGAMVPATSHGWAALAGLALLAQCLGQGLVAYALAHLPATIGAAGIYLQPVAAAVYAWAFLGERLHPVQIIGGLVTVAGIALATSGRVYGEDPKLRAMHANRTVNAADVS